MVCSFPGFYCFLFLPGFLTSVGPELPLKQQGSLYSCPVYKKPRRTDLTYIFSLYLKTVQNPDHWTLRGVALLCNSK
uniref:Dynein heavy chain C-terminal domain-containing protein n=1 Tax=Accipiter nisus TaxID=211598 RepID=A0A8B9NA91_9AVES